MTPPPPTYEPREPSRTVLYQVIAEHLETFLTSLHDDPDAKGLPAYVEREFYDYLQCGILDYGFLRLGCNSCKKEVLLAFSCRRRGFGPSCAGRRMAQTAAHLVECVIPWVPTRQWVVSVPMPLRYWTASSRDLTAQVHTIIRCFVRPQPEPPGLTHRLWSSLRLALKTSPLRARAHEVSVVLLPLSFASALDPATRSGDERSRR